MSQSALHALLLAVTTALVAACGTTAAPPAPAESPTTVTAPAPATHPVSAATTSYRDVRERAFLEVVDDSGLMPLASDEQKLAVGKSLCAALRDGNSKIEVLGATIHEGGMTGYQAGQLIGASTAAFCPEFGGPITG